MSVLRILTIGDPHIKVNNLPEIEIIKEHAAKIIELRKPHLLVVLGDVLHTNARINSYALTAAVNFLRELSALVPQTVLIIGNHDRPNCSDFLSDIHPFTALKDWQNFHVVDKVLALQIEGFAITCLPYVPAGRFAEALATNEKSLPADIIFCHQDFYGARYSTERMADHGDRVENIANTLIISGHIHAYQKLPPNIIYVGTPMQQDFGEDANKGFSFFYFSRSQQPSFTSHGNFFWQEERFQSLVPLRVFRRLTVSEALQFQTMVDKKVKIEIVGSPEEFAALKGNAHIRALEKAGVSIKYAVHTNDNSYDNSETSRLENKTFMETLRESLCNEPELLTITEEIFG